VSKGVAAGEVRIVDGFTALRQLLRESPCARPEDLPDIVIRAAPLLDVDGLVIYLVDHQQRVLVPLGGRSVPAREVMAVDGTLAGRAFTTVSP